MREYLKVKVMSLAAEARIIKTQEQRIVERLERRKRYFSHTADSDINPLARKPQDDRDLKAFWGMRDHRHGLRREARRSHLAYGFIRGQSFQAMEPYVHTNNRLNDKDWEAIEAMIAKYDERDPRVWKQALAVFHEEWELVADKTPWRTEQRRYEKNAERRAKYGSRPRRSRTDWEGRGPTTSPAA